MPGAQGAAGCSKSYPGMELTGSPLNGQVQVGSGGPARTFGQRKRRRLGTSISCK